MFRKKIQGHPTRIQPVVEIKEHGDDTVMLFTDEEHAIPKLPEGEFIGTVGKDKLEGLKPPLKAVTKFEGNIGTISVRSAESKG